MRTSLLLLCVFLSSAFQAVQATTLDELNQLNTQNLISFSGKGNYTYTIRNHINDHQKLLKLSFYQVENAVHAEIQLSHGNTKLYDATFHGNAAAMAQKIQSDLITNVHMKPVAATILGRWLRHLKESHTIYQDKVKMIPMSSLAVVSVELGNQCNINKLLGKALKITHAKSVLVEACISEAHDLPLSVTTNTAEGKPRFSATMVAFE